MMSSTPTFCRFRLRLFISRAAKLGWPRSQRCWSGSYRRTCPRAISYWTAGSWCAHPAGRTLQQAKLLPRIRAFFAMILSPPRHKELLKIFPMRFGAFVPSLLPRQITTLFGFDPLVYSNLPVYGLSQLFSNSLRESVEWI